MKSIIYLFIGMICCFALSCKTTKKLSKPVVEVPDVSDLYLAYAENKLVFDQVEFSANVEYKGDMSLGFSAIFRIQNGEKIWGSFKKFGFEAARMMITNDSVFVINRLQSSFIAEDIAELKKMTGVPVEFDDLQQMIMGGSFWSENLIEANDSTLVKVESIKGQVVEAKHIFDDRKLVRSSKISAQDQGNLEIDYNDYDKVGNASLAFGRSFVVKRTGMNVILEIQTLKFDPQAQKTFPFEIPTNYSRMSF